MSLARSVAQRFLACLLLNVLFVVFTLLFLKPRDISLEAEDAIRILEILSVGTLFNLGVIYFSMKMSGEAFSRRLAASGLLAAALVGQFKSLDAGRYFGIGNPGISAMLAAWVLMIVVAVVLQLLHRLSPSNFR